MQELQTAKTNQAAKETLPKINDKLIDAAITAIHWAQHFAETAKSIPKTLLKDRSKVTRAALVLLGLTSIVSAALVPEPNRPIAINTDFLTELPSPTRPIELPTKTVIPPTSTKAETAPSRPTRVKTRRPVPTPTETPSVTRDPSTPIPAAKVLRATSEALGPNVFTTFKEKGPFTTDLFQKISKNVFKTNPDTGDLGIKFEGSAVFFQTNNPNVSACLIRAIHSAKGYYSGTTYLPEKMTFEQIDIQGNRTQFSAKPYFAKDDAPRDQTTVCFYKSANPDVPFPEGATAVNDYGLEKDHFYLASGYPYSTRGGDIFQSLGEVVQADEIIADVFSLADFIRGDASEGASGGGLFDQEGRLVGNIVAGDSPYFGNSNVRENAIGIAPLRIDKDSLPPDVQLPLTP